MAAVVAELVAAAEAEPEADVAADEVDPEVEVADVVANKKTFFLFSYTTQYNNRILKFVNIFTMRLAQCAI